MAIRQLEATIQLLHQHDCTNTYDPTPDCKQPLQKPTKINSFENIRSAIPAQNQQTEPRVIVHPMIRSGMIDYLPSFQTCDVPDTHFPKCP